MEAAHVSPELPIRWVVSADRTVEIKEEVTELGCDQANERILQEETPPSSITERVEDPELEPGHVNKEVTALEPVHIKEESPVLESAEWEHLSGSDVSDDSTSDGSENEDICPSSQARDPRDRTRTQSPDTVGEQPLTSTGLKARQKNAKRSLLWKTNQNQVHATPEWRDQLPPETSVATPVEYFRALVDDSLLTHTVQQSNLYASQTDNTRPLQIDRLIKLREMFEQICDKLNKIPKEMCLSVDEQVIPFKGRRSVKQCSPKKPKQWGYTVFCLAGASGTAYDLEFYTRQTDHPAHLPCVGASGNVVIRLAQTIPPHCNYRLFFDNWFRSPELEIELAKMGIHSLGTVRLHRIPNIKMPTDLHLKKEGQGSFVEKTVAADDVDLKLVKWHDSRSVHLLSTFAGAYPDARVKRWDKKTKQQVNVKCPSVVKMYSKFMGGVDLLDSLLALYRTNVRTKKYYLHIYFYMMDLCCVVAWLLYRRASDDCGVSCKQQLSLFDFKADVAQSLCWLGKAKKRGSPSGNPENEESVKRRKFSAVPNLDCRKDKFDHWPAYDSKAGRCKHSVCQKLTKVKCQKCDTFLCFVPNRNCFFAFHN
ncbi:piggyBac transposable element-derived protein 3-like isoform X2 [Polyodon spathula]|uniref:piggyBac transposable element-derived protein 3-like isoform X2 n=1 Tax=Polyodon spathula TaxID=7913 RepID=UPI001B7EF875|nr:piggyBac transposable element-derived protein 3-like isoform X2 [Polyodon spathula]